jgi:hypothetical protein
MAEVPLQRRTRRRRRTPRQVPAERQAVPKWPAKTTTTMTTMMWSC